MYKIAVSPYFARKLPLKVLNLGESRDNWFPSRIADDIRTGDESAFRLARDAAEEGGEGGTIETGKGDVVHGLAARHLSQPTNRQR